MLAPNEANDPFSTVPSHNPTYIRTYVRTYIVHVAVKGARASGDCYIRIYRFPLYVAYFMSMFGSYTQCRADLRLPVGACSGLRAG